jgi:hypothetical protein
MDGVEEITAFNTEAPSGGRETTYHQHKRRATWRSVAFETPVACVWGKLQLVNTKLTDD